MAFRLKSKPKETSTAIVVQETEPAYPKLNLKQLRFCKEYAIDHNGAQAAIRAGYSVKTARSIADELLTKPHIRNEVSRLDQEKAQELGITKEKIMRELACIGFSNMSDYMSVDGNGYPHLDFSDLTREQSAALTEVTVDEYMDGMGEDAKPIKKVKFKLADKRSALVDLGKHIGMWREKEGDGSTSITQQVHAGIMAAFLEACRMRKADVTELAN